MADVILSDGEDMVDWSDELDDFEFDGDKKVASGFGATEKEEGPDDMNDSSSREPTDVNSQVLEAGSDDDGEVVLKLETTPIILNGSYHLNGGFRDVNHSEFRALCGLRRKGFGGVDRSKYGVPLRMGIDGKGVMKRRNMLTFMDDKVTYSSQLDGLWELRWRRCSGRWKVVSGFLKKRKISEYFAEGLSY